jgi:thioesterase domain-containing protein
MSPKTKDSGALIELKPGGPRKLFLVHAGDGDPLMYLSLARRMPDDLAVFGIKPRSTPGAPIAHTRIEDMASFYVNEVRKKQPRGPYLLGGLCAGGVIAYEMALQLSRAGESLELLALLEAATPQTPMRRRRITKKLFGVLKRALADARNRERSTLGQWRLIVGAALRELVNDFASKIVYQGEQWWGRVRFQLLHQVLARQLPWPGCIGELSPLQICVSAGARYVPKPLCKTSVVLVRAQRQSIFIGDTPYRAVYADETLGWGAIIQGLAVVDVDGGHSSMLQEPFVGAVAAALMPYINPDWDATGALISWITPFDGTTFTAFDLVASAAPRALGPPFFREEQHYCWARRLTGLAPVLKQASERGGPRARSK